MIYVILAPEEVEGLLLAEDLYINVYEQCFHSMGKFLRRNYL